MLRSTVTVLVLIGVAALAAGPVAAADGQRRFEDPERWSAIWDAPEREQWQRPRVVMNVVGDIDGLAVADLGAGTGYFTTWLSNAVGENGTVYAVDIEQTMLDHVMARELLHPSGNVRPVLAEPADPKLAPASVQLVFSCNTWHHIQDRVAYLRTLQPALRDDGRIVVVDWRAMERPVGPPASEAVARDTVVREFAEAGWTFAGESFAVPYQYVLIFQPPAASAN